MKIKGILIDTQAMAKGLYELFDEKERAVVAFGMLPAIQMENLERLLGEKFEQIAKDQAKKYGFNTDYNVADQDKKKEFVREAAHQISVEIYTFANSIGKMIV